MNNTSWRHHYLLSPGSYFFQKKGNTIINQDNEESDFLEKDYSHFDNNIAKCRMDSTHLP